MKSRIFFFTLFLLFSFSKVKAQKDFKIIHASYYNWYGGVKGVKGKVFEIQISKTSKKEVVIKKMIINGVKFDVTSSASKGIILVSARINEGDDPDVLLNSPLEKNKFYLEYVYKKNGKWKRLKIPNFELNDQLIKKQQKKE